MPAGRSRTVRPAAAWLAVLAPALLLAACGNAQRVADENDRLRREALETSKTVARLEGEVAELKIKLAEEARVREGTLPQEALEALPRITAVTIDSLSGFTPVDAAAPATGAVVYIRPRDGRDRFVQAVGTLNVEVIAMPQAVSAAEGPTTEPRRIAAISLAPGAIREAYRSGITGTHYAVELPFSEPLARDASLSFLIRAEFLDALTGQVHRADRVIGGPKLSN